MTDLLDADGARDTGAVLLEQIRRGRPLARRLIKASLSFVLASVVAITVAAGAFIFYLDRAPIIVPSLGPRIEQALDARLGHGYKFSVGDVAIANSSFGPTLAVDRLQLSGNNGETIFESIHGAEVSVDPIALLSGRVVPRRLDVADVELRLVLMPDGSLAVSAGSEAKATLALWHPLAASAQESKATTPGDPLPQAVAPQPVHETTLAPQHRALLVQHIGAALRLLVDVATNPDSPLAVIDRVGLARGRLVIEDRASGRSKIFDGLNFSFEKSGGETHVKLSAEGPSGRWSVVAKATGLPGQTRRLEIAMQDFSLEEILLVAGVRSVGLDFDMPIASRFALNLAPDGNLTEIAGSLSMGSGYMRFDDPDDEPKFVESIAASFHWDRNLRRIAIDEARLRTGATSFAIAGAIVAPVNEGEAWTIDLANPEKLVVGPELPGDAPIELDKFNLQGKLDVGNKTLAIDRFAFSGPECGFAMAGAIDWQAGPHLRLGASIDPTPARVAVRLWPTFLIADVRTWFLYHWKEGIVQSARMQLNLTGEMIETMRRQHAPPDDATKLDFTISNGSVDFLPGVPPLRNITGEGHITGQTSTFVATSGTLEAGGRKLTMSEGAFRIPNTDLKPTPAELTAKVSGSIEAVGDLLSRDSLKPYANLPIDATTMKGQIEGKLTIGVKLGSGGGRPEDTTFRTNATASNFSADKIVGNERLENATLNVVVDAVGLHASGQGRMFNGPATLDLSKPIGKPGTANVSVVLDDAARAKQGLTAFSNVTGPITVHIGAPLAAQQDMIKAQVEVDLAHANVEVAPGVVKAAGKPGRANFALTVDRGSIQLDQVQFDAPPVFVRGSVEISADQSNISAKFSQVKLSPGDDMKVDLTKTGDALKFTVRGTAIDARPFLKHLTFAHPEQAAADPSPTKEAGKESGKEASNIKDVELDLKAPLVTGFNKQALSNVELRVAKHGEHLRQFALTGRFGRTAVIGTLTGAGSPSPQLNLTSADAGSLMAFIDLYQHMEGGELAVSMRLGEDALAGVMDIENFALHDEPALRRLVAEGAQQSQNAWPGDRQHLDANFVRFNRLHVSFQRVGSRLDLHEARMNGDNLGLTIDGWLDFTRDRISLDGTFVPAFFVNNLPSQIPFFGTLLGGGQHEGVFGLNFHISGSVSNPVLNFNPFSVMAPGIFRKIFGAIDAPELPFAPTTTSSFAK
jgi:Protein of unknown function/AsmA-like C-terminal region